METVNLQSLVHMQRPLMSSICVSAVASSSIRVQIAADSVVCTQVVLHSPFDVEGDA